MGMASYARDVYRWRQSTKKVRYSYILKRGKRISCSLMTHSGTRTTTRSGTFRDGGAVLYLIRTNFFPSLSSAYPLNAFQPANKLFTKDIILSCVPTIIVETSYSRPRGSLPYEFRSIVYGSPATIGFNSTNQLFQMLHYVQKLLQRRQPDCGIKVFHNRPGGHNGLLPCMAAIHPVAARCQSRHAQQI